MGFDRGKFGVISKRIRQSLRRMGAVLRKVHLVDKCLLILMAMLMAQSAYILLSNGGNVAEANHIDIIIRTSAASIFGYFLSANFVQRGSNAKANTAAIGGQTEPTSKSVSQSDAPQNRIGFTTQDDSEDAQKGIATSDKPQAEGENRFGVERLQVITVAIVAVFCTAALILARDLAGAVETANPSSTAVASQFRDFVSGCVGFLIGCPTQRSAKGNNSN